MTHIVIEQKSVRVQNEYLVFNKKRDVLGQIVYEKKWKEWVVLFHEDTYMSVGCMKEVMDYLQKLNETKPKG